MSDILTNVRFNGMKRYYVEDLTQKDYLLENTVPYKITVLGETIEEHSWGNLLCEVVKLLLVRAPKSVEKMLEFRVSWTKKPMFSIDKRTNHKPVQAGLYLNCNHTALHSCWLLGEILDYFQIDKSEVVFLIHRAPSAEPKAAREYFENQVKADLQRYLEDERKITKDEAEKIISCIENELNPMLAKESKGYNNFFLFDEYAYAYNYAKAVSKKVTESLSIKDRTPLIECLEVLIGFYKVLSAKK